MVTLTEYDFWFIVKKEYEIINTYMNKEYSRNRKDDSSVVQYINIIDNIDTIYPIRDILI